MTTTDTHVPRREAKGSVTHQRHTMVTATVQHQSWQLMLNLKQVYEYRNSNNKMTVFISHSKC